MAFQTKTFRSLVASEINRARVSTTKVTDYNEGSVERTILEAPAQELDRLYQELLVDLLGAIGTSVYTSFNFPALPPIPASGTIRVTVAVQGQAIIIPAGSILTRSDSSASYAVTVDTIIPAGASFGDVAVSATTAGTAGNMPAGGQFTLSPEISGFISATNLLSFIDGAPGEPTNAQKVRFDTYLADLARGTSAAIKAALLRLAAISDSNGNLIEHVASVSIVKPYQLDPSKPPGLVQAYVHNGTGNTSSALVANAQAVVNGYLDASGAPVSGYKAAGVRYTVFPAVEVPLAVIGTLTVAPTSDPVVVVAQVTAVLTTYVLGIEVGEAYIGAVADDLVMQVPGVLNWVPLGTLAYVGVQLSQKLVPANFRILAWLAAATAVKTATSGELVLAAHSSDLGTASGISADNAVAALTAVDHGANLVGTGQSSDSGLLDNGGFRTSSVSNDSASAVLTTGFRLAGSAASADTGTGTATNFTAPAIFITPGVGSFTDAQNNTYTLSAAGVATENGLAMAGGGGTAQMALYQGTVYGQDATTKAWYTWNGTQFVGGATAPPGGPVTPPGQLIPSQVAGNLDVPWDIAFLPDGSFLVTQRDTFSVRRCSSSGATLGSFTIPNTVTTSGEGGLMGVAVDPNFGSNGFVYFCHTRTYSGGYTPNGNEVVRYVLNTTNNTISGATVLVTYGSGQFHNGGQIAFGPDGKLYVTTGNGTSPNNTSQVLTGSAVNDGKILRINSDGTIPTDNPFNTDGTKASAADGKSRSAVWTWGHRNPQGICWDAAGNCWSTENGPTGESFGTFSGIRGNDKINLIVKGKNYGFPLAYGPNTATDSFGIQTQAPVFTSGNNETWAPEGIIYLNGSIFFCALGGLGSPPGTASINQFKISGAAPTSGITKNIADGHRKRAATLGSDGLLYYSTSDGDGRGSQAAGTDVVYKLDLSSLAPPAVTPSPAGTVITTAGAAITDTAGSQWTLSGTARNFTVLINGAADAATGHVTGLLFQNNRIYRQDCVGAHGGNVYDWYYKASSTDTWHGPFSDPRIVQPTNFIDITASPYNAKGDGSTDNTVAIANAFAAAKAAGMAVFIPAGNFFHSGMITQNGITVFGTGNSSILTASNPAASAIQITGDGAVLSDVMVNVLSTGRLTTMQAAGIWVNGATNYTITRVLVNASACAGIYSVNASKGKIQYNTVSNTLADSITQTFGSNQILVDGNCTYHSGDDGISNNTYVGDAGYVNNIIISNNSVLLNLGGRCLEVSGGINIAFSGNYGSQNPGNPYAGLFLATEISSFQTEAVSTISFVNNTLVNDGGQHGAIILWGENTNYSITGITINGNQIVTPLSNPVQIRGDATIQALIENTSVYSDAGYPFYNNTGTHATITGSGNTTSAASSFGTPLGWMHGGCGAGSILGEAAPQPGTLPSAAPPSAPQNIQMAAVTNNPTTTTAQLAWTAPATGNGSYTYESSYIIDGATSGASLPVTGITATSFTQTGLLPATLYDFKVRAVDSLGQAGPWAATGAWSTAATDTPVANETPPGPPLFAPGSSIINSIGEKFAMVPKAGTQSNFNDLTVNGVIDPFFSDKAVRALLYANHIVYVQADVGTFAKVEASQPWTLFTGLGGIPSTPPVIDPTKPGTPPSAVTGLGLQALVGNPTQTSIALLWGLPIGTGPFTFAFAYKKHSDANFGPASGISYQFNSLSFNQTGLTPNTAYDFRIAAIDVWGQQGPWAVTGPWSTLATPVPPPPPPPGDEYISMLGYTFLAKYVGSTANCDVYYDVNAYTNPKPITTSGQTAGNNALAAFEGVLANLQRLYGNIYTVKGGVTPRNLSGTRANIVLTTYQMPFGALHGNLASTQAGFESSNIIIACAGTVDQLQVHMSWILTAEMGENFFGELNGLKLYEDAYGFGEGLSQVLSSLLYPGTEANGYGSGYDGLAVSWLTNTDANGNRKDFVNNNALVYATDGSGYLAVGCNWHFINWLRFKGYSLGQIFNAINACPTSGIVGGVIVPPCSGRDVYNKLTGSTAVDPFPTFAADVAAKMKVKDVTGGLLRAYPGGDLWQTPVR